MPEDQWQYQYLHVGNVTASTYSNHYRVPCQGTNISKLRSSAAHTMARLGCGLHDGWFAVQALIRVASFLGAGAGICNQMLCILPACPLVHSQMIVMVTGLPAVARHLLSVS